MTAEAEVPRFLAGTPRSGSTLLAALLNEHSNLSVTPTGWLVPLVESMRQGYTNAETRKAWRDQEDARERFYSALRGACAGYLGRLGVEKSRGAPVALPSLHAAFGECPRVVVMVRDLRDVVSSMERKHAAAPEIAAAPTLEARVENWLKSGPLGESLTLLRDYGQSGWLRKAHVIRYEDLLSDPVGQVSAVVSYLGGTLKSQPTHTAGDDREHDAVHGPVGDHRLPPGPIAEPSSHWRQTITPALASRVIQAHQWYYATFYPEAIRASDSAA